MSGEEGRGEKEKVIHWKTPMRERLLFSISILLFLLSPLSAKAEHFSDEELLFHIDQMLMVGFRGESVLPGSDIDRILKETSIGGVILFDYDTPTKRYQRNIANSLQLQELTRVLQQRARVPLLIAIDEEGGRVSRLKKRYGFQPIPSAAELGRGSATKTKQQSYTLAAILKRMGINVNFAPVVDVALNPNNRAIVRFDRAFSSDPELVSTHAKAFLEGHLAQSVIPVLKHFPGHGSATPDSHQAIPDVTETFKPLELLPYRKLVTNSTVPAIMVGHLLNRSLDTIFPASLSRNTIQSLLRRDLSFSGTVFSDDYDMASVRGRYELRTIVRNAVYAGVDVLVFSNNGASYDPELMFKIREEIKQAVREGFISEEEIIEASRRVEILKRRFGILPEKSTTP